MSLTRSAPRPTETAWRVGPLASRRSPRIPRGSSVGTWPCRFGSSACPACRDYRRADSSEAGCRRRKPLVYAEVRGDHRIQREALSCSCAATLTVDTVAERDRIGHFLGRGCEKAGDPGFDDVVQRTGGEGNDRTTAGERLHGHERTRFGHQAGDQQNAGRCQEPALACEAYRTEKAGVAAEPWPDLLRKISLVGLIREYLTAQQQQRAGESSRIERQMKAFFRADAPECEGEIASGMARLKEIDRHTVRDWVDHVRERWE